MVAQARELCTDHCGTSPTDPLKKRTNYRSLVPFFLKNNLVSGNRCGMTCFRVAVHFECITAFQVKEITVGSECVYNSDVLLFARNAEVKGNGIVHVSGKYYHLITEFSQAVYSNF